MFLDARDLPTDTVLDCDVCIVGAGFSGIAAAWELDGTPWKVILLESGGRKLDPLTQDLHQGTTLRPGHGALHLYRERRFGGTSHVWGGRCNPFDAIDMEPRDWVEHSGWPITRQELDPYYVRAYDYCDLGRYGLTVEELLPPDAQKQMVPGLASDVVKTDRLWLFSLPTKFTKKFNDQLAQSSSVHVYLHTTCLSLETDPDSGRVEHVEMAFLTKNRFRIRAGQFMLVMGGLETTRLLMLLYRHHSGGIGNAHGNLGRFYISHITGNAGQVRFTPSGPLMWDYERTVDGVYCRRAFRIDEKVQRKRELLNFRAIPDFPEINDPSHGLAILSAMYLAKRFLVRRIPPE
jgi:choline dehydrogenase-like flavoprotein